MNVQNIDYEFAESVVDTLHEAFYDYPVMRFVLGPNVENFESRHVRLIRLFVMARVFCNEPLLGIGDRNNLSAVAVVSLPETKGIPVELTEYRKQVWATFESEAKARYDAFAAACSQFDVELPHHHLNMIGVRRSHQGSGFGRKIVEHVIGIAEQHPGSYGVSLSTEHASNVPFYEYLGFELTGHAKVGPGLQTWNFFREKSGIK